MRHFHMLRNHQWAPTINIEKLWSLVPTEAREKYISGAKTDSAPVIDLLSHGYAKLLGKGKTPFALGSSGGRIWELTHL
jgi:large subunit ribosomal protein L27Ae